MAKEEIHNWMRTGLMIAVIVFAGGGWTFQIAGNTSKIADEKKERSDADKILTAKTDKLVEDTHLLALNAKDTQALAASAAAASQKSVEMFNRIQRQLEDRSKIDASMQLDIREIQVQIKTLMPTKE